MNISSILFQTIDENIIFHLPTIHEITSHIILMTTVLFFFFNITFLIIKFYYSLPRSLFFCSLSCDDKQIGVSATRISSQFKLNHLLNHSSRNVQIAPAAIIDELRPHLSPPNPDEHLSRARLPPQPLESTISTSPPSSLHGNDSFHQRR